MVDLELEIVEDEPMPELAAEPIPTVRPEFKAKKVGYEVFREKVVNEDGGNVWVPVAYAPINFADIPNTCASMVLDAWKGFKGIGAPVPQMSVNLDGLDYELLSDHNPVPTVTVTERVSSVYRSANQLRLASLGGEIDGWVRDRTLIQGYIDGGVQAQADLDNARETRIDKDHIKKLEASLENWDVRAAEFQHMIDGLNLKIETTQNHIGNLLDANTSGSREWVFNLGYL